MFDEEHIDPHGECATEITRLTAEGKAMRLALEEIVNPLKFMQERAEQAGARLNHMAYEIAHNSHHLQSIAAKALANLSKETA